MTQKFRAFHAFFLFLALMALSPSSLRAQASQESHPAYQVVISYLTYAMGQDWPKSAALIEEESLTGLRDRYMERIASARTVQEELEMCRALDCSNLTEAQTLDPTDFYIRYHNGIQKRFPVTQEKLDTILKSKRVKLLSLGEEALNGVEFAHVLVRTKHDNGSKSISSLELISLIKINGKWQVTLDAMRPSVTDSPLAGAGSTETPKK